MAYSILNKHQNIIKPFLWKLLETFYGTTPTEIFEKSSNES